MTIVRDGVTRHGNRTRLMGCFDQECIMAACRRKGFFLTDQEIWDQAVALVREEYAALSVEAKSEVQLVCAIIRGKKEELYSIAESSGAPGLCAVCGGACCSKGKYHFTVVDLLAYLSEDFTLFSPDFHGGQCPYLHEGRCLMSPQFRPLTCIIFHCEPLERMMSCDDFGRMYSLERELREYYRRLEGFFGNRFSQGLILNYTGYLRGRSAGVLAGVGGA